MPLVDKARRLILADKKESGYLAPDNKGKLFKDFRSLSHKILRFGDLGDPNIVFARYIARLLMNSFGCDFLELRLVEGHGCIQCVVTRHPNGTIRYSTLPCSGKLDEISCEEHSTELNMLSDHVINNRTDPANTHFTKYGSFWTGDSNTPIPMVLTKEGMPVSEKLLINDEHKTVAIIPLKNNGEMLGLIILKKAGKDFYSSKDIELFEAIAETIGIARSQQLAQTALRERVKELMCLYGIAKLVEKPDIPLDDVFNGIINLIPPGWQYPKITCSRIIMDEVVYAVCDFKDEWQVQSADIIVNGIKRGSVDVAYLQDMPQLDEGPFLKEERTLIKTIALQIGQIIERRKAGEERRKLQEQLRHADRLATIGLLAAGVAHEFNDPIGNILGFAQLLLKNENLPEDIAGDIDKIVIASLHAREVIKKLMLFARQLPAKKTKVSLNEVVNDGLIFLEARCATAGIELIRSLSPDIPEITADRSQLNQILINLVVNALQALPDGGTITIATRPGKGGVHLVVEDTGIGMNRETLNKIFLPFFTTKDIDEGTGLGLAVVHGIVSSHGGTTNVESRAGKGSKFDIYLPVEVNNENTKDILNVPE